MATTSSRNRGLTLSEKHLRRMGGLGLRYDFLRLLALRDVTPPFGSDFLVKALDTTNTFTIAATSTGTTWAVQAEAGGYLRGVTGASVATGSLQIQAPQKYWTPSGYGLFACSYKIDSISDVRIECGFADVLPAINTTLVNSLSTPTFNSAVQAAAYVYDATSGVSTVTSGLYTIGTSVAAAKALTTTFRPAASTPHLVVVEIDEGQARLWTGDSDEPLATAAAALTVTTGMLPFFMVKTASGSKTVDLDFFYAWSGRLG